jgi:hypothetical protein
MPHLDDSFPGTVSQRSNDTDSSAVKLRDHPRMRHRDAPNWPPVWRQSRIDGVKEMNGEVGVLIYVYAAADSRKCYLVIEHENENYTGTLLFDDARLSRQVAKLLQHHRGQSIKEIGDLDVSLELQTPK